jgi:hypothetical protein
MLYTNYAHGVAVGVVSLLTMVRVSSVSRQADAHWTRREQRELVT